MKKTSDEEYLRSKIREFRDYVELSRANFAKKINVSYTTVKNMEGSAKITVEYLESISTAYKSDLLGFLNFLYRDLFPAKDLPGIDDLNLDKKHKSRSDDPLLIHIANLKEEIFHLRAQLGMSTNASEYFKNKFEQSKRIHKNQLESNVSLQEIIDLQEKEIQELKGQVKHEKS